VSLEAIGFRNRPPVIDECDALDGESAPVVDSDPHSSRTAQRLTASLRGAGILPGMRAN